MSQEEIAVLKTYYSDPFVCNGTVVEMGALNGIKFSNSYYFEYALGWKSVLIEADPNNFAKLQRNRPGSVNVHGAICSGNSVEFMVGRTDATGGVLSSMGVAHQEMWASGKTISVPCKKLSDVWKEHGIQHIDVFFLDVEGGELAVLETMDWSVSVDVWVVEFNMKDEDDHEAVRSLLTSNGYRKASWNIRSFCTKPDVCGANDVYESEAFQSRIGGS